MIWAEQILGRGQPSPERGKLREERDVEAMRPVGPRSGRRWRKNLKSLEASRRRLSARRLLRRETRQLGEEAIRPGVGGALRSPDVGRSLLVGVDASLPASPPPSREKSFPTSSLVEPYPRVRCGLDAE
jgi:hypothetical protein